MSGSSAEFAQAASIENVAIARAEHPSIMEVRRMGPQPSSRNLEQKLLQVRETGS